MWRLKWNRMRDKVRGSGKRVHNRVFGLGEKQFMVCNKGIFLKPQFKVLIKLYKPRVSDLVIKGLGRNQFV
jgi:hypothetical protein